MPTTSDKPASIDKTDIRLAALAQAILRANDPYTAHHQERVAAIVLLIARELGVPDARLTELYYAGIVHDIGKVAIPSQILTKPARLTDDEMRLMRTHVERGVEILRSVGFFQPVVDVIAQHHERLDGSGYPGALSGDAISLAARILAVADVYESMTSHRPYRPSLGIDAAVSELRRGAGSIYDAEIVGALDRILGNMGDLDQISLMGV